MEEFQNVLDLLLLLLLVEVPKMLTIIIWKDIMLKKKKRLHSI